MLIFRGVSKAFDVGDSVTLFGTPHRKDGRWERSKSENTSNRTVRDVGSPIEDPWD